MLSLYSLCINLIINQNLSYYDLPDIIYKEIHEKEIKSQCSNNVNKIIEYEKTHLCYLTRWGKITEIHNNKNLIYKCLIKKKLN